MRPPDSPIMIFLILALVGMVRVIDAEVILLTYDDGDYYATESVIPHFNISHMFFKDLTPAYLVLQKQALLPNTTADYLCDEITNASIIISIARDPNSIQTVIELAALSRIPTIQIRWESPWKKEGYEVDVNVTLPDDLPNYISLIHPSLVFQSSILDIFPLMEIEEDLVVLRDDIFNRGFNTWRFYLNTIPGVNVTYKNLALTPEKIRSQINTLVNSENRRTIVFVATTENIQRWVYEATRYIEAGQLQMFAFTKDITPFQCDECAAVNMFWIRPYSTNKVQDTRDYNDFIIKNEINTELGYSIKPWEELDVAFYYDIMNASSRYIKSINATYAKWGYTAFNCLFEPQNTSLPFVPFLLTRKVNEYGSYIEQSPGLYYEDVPVRVYRVWRRTELPDERYSKMMANWTTTTGLMLYYDRLTELPQDIKFYRIVTIVQPPFIDRLPDGSFVGYCIDMMTLIAAQLNISYTIFEVEDGSFGTIDENGNWNGLMGSLVSGSADFALGPLSVTSERENDVDFTVPYYDLVGTTILMKKSDPPYSLFRFLDVLEWPVWLCIGGAYLFTSFLLWIFERFSPYSYSNNKERYKDDVEKREFSLKECLWFCMTSLTPQGGGEAPKNISGRLVAATWWLFGFIIIASYTANLAAFLTVSRLEQTVKSLDDLAKQYKIEYAPTKGSASETYFRRMAEIEERFYQIWKEMSLNESMTARDRARLAVWDYPVSDKYTNMWRYMKECGLPETIEDAIQRVFNAPDGFAYIGDATEIKYATLTHCNLQQIGTEFSRKPFAMAVHPGHPLKNDISIAILYLMNNRKLETLRDRWWNDNPNKVKCRASEDDGEGISIDNIGGVFIVIASGMIAALVICIFEKYYHKRRAYLVSRRKKHTPASSPVDSSIELDQIDSGKDSISHASLPPPFSSIDGTTLTKRRGSHIVEEGKREEMDRRYDNPAFE
ncbi:hypothetical protein PENTCL1PPCAC_12289 [Pristionchus entomophagus]|uniref:Glr-3 n=1 Tax=Pristionchus entomophagus TaxID=358040 RepID=A0AAV5TBP2_9BILA|nr:hypothetical protein PENTCL1PPCAC_12289 [Pristionchus entomophagus]